jgi:hypothetical protein
VEEAGADAHDECEVSRLHFWMDRWAVGWVGKCGRGGIYCLRQTLGCSTKNDWVVLEMGRGVLGAAGRVCAREILSLTISQGHNQNRERSCSMHTRRSLRSLTASPTTTYSHVLAINAPRSG